MYKNGFIYNHIKMDVWMDVWMDGWTLTISPTSINKEEQILPIRFKVRKEGGAGSFEETGREFNPRQSEKFLHIFYKMMNFSTCGASF